MRLCFVPHEQLDNDIAADEYIRVKISEAVDLRQVPYDHPVVLAHQGQRPIVPLSLFVDGVPYGVTDDAIGFGLVDIVIGSRYLSAVLRKLHGCNCGCRWWFSFHAIFSHIAWKTRAVGEGRFPSTSTTAGMCTARRWLGNR